MYVTCSTLVCLPISPKPGVFSIDDRACELFATGEKPAHSQLGGGVIVGSATGDWGIGVPSREDPGTLPSTASLAAFSLASIPGDCDFGAGLS